MTVVDRLTKYTLLFPLKKITAENVARVLFDNVVLRWGVPNTIVSDRDTAFVSNFW